MSENQPFDFLKIAGHGSIIPKPYLLVLSSKKKEDRTMFCFWQMVFFKMEKVQNLKVFLLLNFVNKFKFFRIFRILS
jgi:hypothetical protein